MGPEMCGNNQMIPGSGRSPGERNGNPLQYSCLRNSMDRRDWQAIVYGIKKELVTTEQLNNNNLKWITWLKSLKDTKQYSMRIIFSISTFLLSAKHLIPITIWCIIFCGCITICLCFLCKGHLGCFQSSYYTDNEATHFLVYIKIFFHLRTYIFRI